MARSQTKEKELAVSSKSFCDALGRFASGITVVTGLQPDGCAAGVTVSAFSSVSLDPPLILVCLGKSTTCIQAFLEGAHFTVNILSHEQMALSENFARRSKDKFEGVDYQIGENGCPILPGCQAVIECRHQAVYDAGDHVILIGEVERIETSPSDEPLLHFRGAYHRLGSGLTP